MISEKGLCKILKSSYKNGGYSIIQVRRKVDGLARSWKRNEIIINGATWAVRCQAEDLPKAAAVQIVGDVGYMPMDAVTVQKNQPNQTMLENIVDTRIGSLAALNGDGVRMRQIPVIFRERWQLYQTETGNVYAFDTELLKLIDFKIEFGRLADGTIILADEISPDTCRLWDVKTNEKLDKDRFRRDMGGTEEAYQEVMKRIFGE